MKIAVTGSSGFIGRQVDHHLTALGHDVKRVDVQGSKPIDFTTATPEDFDGVQVICHLGAIGDVYACAQDPAEAFRINVGGTANVAYCAQKVGAKVVYASTWEVYDRPSGDSPWTAHDEYSMTAPHHPYNVSKLAGEAAITDGIILRLGTAYGPGMRPNSVFRRFIDLGKKGEPITVNGEGATRQFVHVHDVARAFGMAAEYAMTEVDYSRFNIVGDEMTSIASMAELIRQRFNVPVHKGPARDGDVKSAWVSNALAETVLKWRPTRTFAEGFRELMEE